MPNVKIAHTSDLNKQLFIDSLFCFCLCWQLQCDANVNDNIITPVIIATSCQSSAKGMHQKSDMNLLIDNLFYLNWCQELCCDAAAINDIITPMSWCQQWQWHHADCYIGHTASMYWVTASFVSADACNYAMMLMAWWQQCHANTSKSIKWLLTDILLCFSWHWQLCYDTDAAKNIVILTPQYQHWWHHDNCLHRSHIKLDEWLFINIKSYEWLLTDRLLYFSKCKQIHCDGDASSDTLKFMLWCQKWW